MITAAREAAVVVFPAMAATDSRPGVGAAALAVTAGKVLGLAVVLPAVAEEERSFRVATVDLQRPVAARAAICAAVVVAVSTARMRMPQLALAAAAVALAPAILAAPVSALPVMARAALTVGVAEGARLMAAMEDSAAAVAAAMVTVASATAALAVLGVAVLMVLVLADLGPEQAVHLVAMVEEITILARAAVAEERSVAPFSMTVAASRFITALLQTIR